MEEQTADRLRKSLANTDADLTPTQVTTNIGLALVQKMHTDPAWHRLLAEYAAIARRDPVTAEGLRRGRRQVREKIAGVLENYAETFGVQLPMPAPDLAVVLLALSTGLALETDMEPAGIRDDLFAQVLTMMAANVTIDRAVSRS